MPVRRSRAVIAPLALGVGRTGPDRRDTIRLRPFDFVFPGRRRVEMQAHKQIRAAWFASAGRSGNSTYVSLVRVRMTLKPAFLSWSRNSPASASV